jgi:hypothetical protein
MVCWAQATLEEVERRWGSTPNRSAETRTCQRGHSPWQLKTAQKVQCFRKRRLPSSEEQRAAETSIPDSVPLD